LSQFVAGFPSFALACAASSAPRRAKPGRIEDRSARRRLNARSVGGDARLRSQICLDRLLAGLSLRFAVVLSAGTLRACARDRKSLWLAIQSPVFQRRVSY